MNRATIRFILEILFFLHIFLQEFETREILLAQDNRRHTRLIKCFDQRGVPVSLEHTISGSHGDTVFCWELSNTDSLYYPERDGCSFDNLLFRTVQLLALNGPL